MNPLFDYDNQANRALVGGQSADAAMGTGPRAGLSVPPVYASPAAARAVQMRAENDRMLADLQAQRQPRAPREPLLGYNRQTNEVFSGGQTFALDVGPGLKALQAGLLDADNPQLPPGFAPVPAGQVRKRLADMYDQLGFVDSIQRRAGQSMQNFGSLTRDLTGDAFGQGLEDAGTQIVENNPAQITTPGQIVERPWQFAKESVGQVVPDVAANLGVTAAGAATGAKLGAAVAPFLGPLAPAAPVAGAVIGGGLARFGLTAPETYGSVRREQREQGIDDRGRAAISAAGSAALESVFEPGGRVGRALGTMGRKVEQKAAKDLLAPKPITAGTVAKDIGLSALGEGATEIPQSAVERWGAFKPLDTPEAVDEYIMAGAAGAVGGGAFGPLQTAGRAAENKQARDLLAQRDAAATALEAARVAETQRLAAARDQQDQADERALGERNLQQWGQFGPQLENLRSDQLQMAEENPEQFADWRNTQINAYAGDPELVSNLADRPGGPLPPTNRVPPPAWRPARPVAPPPATTGVSPTADGIQPAPEQSGAGLSEPTVQAPEPVQEKPTEDFLQADKLLTEIERELDGKPLSAAIFSERADVSGKLSKPMRVVAAIAKALRSNRGAGATVRKPGVTEIDVGMQKKFQDDLIGILGAAREVINAADSLATLESSRLPSDKRVSGKKIAKEAGIASSDLSYNDKVAQIKGQRTVDDLTVARTRLSLAVDEFVRASGSEKNAQSVVGVFKTLVQGAPSSRPTDKVKAAAARAASKLTGEPVDATQFRAERSMDALLSGAWARYKDGTLNVAESMDVVRSRPIRNSAEDTKRGAAPPLVEAAEEGKFGHPVRQGAKESDEAFVKRKAAQLQFGPLGVLEYLKAHGTLFERTLSTAISRALKRFAADERPTLKWIGPNEKPFYDPKTRTIGIHSEESPEVILHEMLHAALQWFVYAQPKHPDVKALMVSVDALLNYKGEVPAKAKDVIDVLNKIVNRKTNKDTAQLDAVLELISYGNTLREFREFLKTLPQVTSSATKEDPWFVNASKALWKHISALLQRMTGLTNSMARDVLERSVALLEEASDPDGATPPAGVAKGSAKLKSDEVSVAPEDGNILEAAVTSTSHPTPQSITPVLAADDLERYTKHVVPKFLSSQFLFGTWWGSGVVPAVDKLSSKVVETLDKDFPGIMRWARWFSSRMGYSTELAGMFSGYENDLFGGSKVIELVARELYNDVTLAPTAQGMELLQYLDGDKTKLADNVPLREKADHLLKLHEAYVLALPPAERRFFQNLKFSEGLIGAGSSTQLASRSMGIRELSKLARVEVINEQAVDTRYVDTDARGNPTVGGRYYSVKVLVNGQLAHSYFVAESKLARWRADAVARAAGEVLDEGKVWQVGQVRRDRKVPFEAVKTAAEAMQQSPKAVADAIRNTMTTLAANHASREFTSSLWTLGRTGTDVDARAVAFDSVNEIEQVLGYKPAPGTVIDINSADAKTSQVRGNLRSRYQWFQIPKSPKYGLLSGKIIRGDVWSSIEDMQNTHPIKSLIRTEGAMRVFKKAKTVYNPGTHLTNIATNFSWLYMHDIPLRSLVDASKLLARYSVDPKAMAVEDRKLMLEFIGSNAMIGDFASTELKRDIYDALNASLKANEPGVGAKAFSSVADYIGVLSVYEKHKSKIMTAARAAGKFDDVLTQIYSNEDNVFRLAAFLTKAGEYVAANGDLDADGVAAAGDFARHAFLDYNTSSLAPKMLRQTILPFVSWAYAAIPMLGHLALHKPWKMINMFTGFWMLEQAMQMAAGDSDDEDEAKRKVGQKWARDRLLMGFGPFSYIRVPFMGTDERPVYYKLGAYLPTSAFGDTVPNPPLGMSGWPAPLVPGGPFVGMALMLFGGIDPYTGEKLTPKTSSDVEKAYAGARAFSNMFVPNVPLLNSNDSRKLDELMNNKRGLSGGDISNLQLARWFGLKLYDYNLGDAQAQQSAAQGAIKREFELEIARLRRSEARFEKPDWDSFYEKRDDLFKRMQKQMAEARGEE